MTSTSSTTNAVATKLSTVSTSQGVQGKTIYKLNGGSLQIGSDVERIVIEYDGKVYHKFLQLMEGKLRIGGDTAYIDIFWDGRIVKYVNGVTTETTIFK